jgi:hypothetical protein
MEGKPNDSVARGAPYICQYRMIQVRYAHGGGECYKNDVEAEKRKEKKRKRQERNKLIIRVSS